MKSLRFVLLFALISAVSATAQSPESYRGLLSTRVRSQKLSAPQHLQAYVDNGKLKLSLRDAILLALENNSTIQIDETAIESQKFSLLSSFSLFDPSVQSTFTAYRSSSPSYSQLQGVGTSSKAVLNSLNHSGQIYYLQAFPTGTSITAGISGNRYSTNSAYNYFNPYYSSTLSLQFTQPLLRNFGRFVNMAQIHIARRSLDISREQFASQVNDSILQVISQYWNAVQAARTLDVQQRAQKLAEASYTRDKRALELGALPPLDISRSEAEVASRKVLVIQAAYALSQAEEALRITIGADQDPQYRALGFQLTESPEPVGDLKSIDADALLADALKSRPEVSAATAALENDETRVRYAKNQLKPDLSLSGTYQSSGLGGSQYNLSTGSLISSGGLGSSFDQMFGFGYPTYSGTLTLNLPIRNRGAQARLGSALVSRTRDLYSQRQTMELITQEARNVAFQLDEAKQALAAAIVSFDLAKKTLAADQRKFELGAETNFFVLDSQERLAQAELVLLQSQIGYQLAVASVGHASGDLLTPYRLQIEAASR